MRSLLTVLSIVGVVLAGSTLATATDPLMAPNPAAATRLDGVELRLAVSPKVWEGDKPPTLTLTFVNHGTARVRVVSPLDGSWEGMRAPGYTLEMIDERGAVVQDVLGVPGGRCGMTNPLVPEQDILSLEPGARISAQRSPNTFPFYGTVLADARPGNYRARVRYRADAAELPGATALELVSNSVAVTVRGGNLALWQCQREQKRLALKQRYVAIEPLDLRATGDGTLALYRAQETTVTGATSRRSGELFLQRLGPTGAPSPRWPALSLARADGLALARVAAIDGGALVLYTVDARVHGTGPETLHAVVLRGADDAWQVGPARQWATVATAYGLALARSGDRLAALYLSKGTGPIRQALSFQAIDRAGAAIGEPVRLAASAGLDAQLAVDPRSGEFWAAWTDTGKSFVQALGADGRASTPAIAIGEGFGSLDELWPQAPGFALAYQKNFTRGEIANDAMAYYLQGFDKTGAKLDKPGLLSPPSRGDPHWGELAWSERGAARAYVQQRINRDGRQQEPSDLMFGPLGLDARVVASSLLGEPTIAASGEEFVVAWSDARDDGSKACLRLGACVGELYVASWRLDGTQRLAPTRLTRLAVPRPPVAIDDRWRELCE